MMVLVFFLNKCILVRCIELIVCNIAQFPTHLLPEHVFLKCVHV